jgi:hypothetical protein
MEMPLGWLSSPEDKDLGFSVHNYHYAKGMVAVHTPSDNGYKTRAARVVEVLGGRWVRRANGYVLSHKKVVKLRTLLSDGYDANLFRNEFIKPVI